LKAVPAEVWKDMLDLVNCQVLSIVESEHVDAYLLSESSMFIFPHKLILKTCGTTTLLCGLPRILQIAATIAGFPQGSTNGPIQAATPYRVFYSRKNFLFPDRQRGPHRSWRDEVKSLDRLFLGGSAYMIGKMNGEHWYLYLTEPNTMLTPPATPDRNVTETKIIDIPASPVATLCGEQDDMQDETLEILMTDLEENNAKQFYLDHASAVAEGRYFQQAHKARKDGEQHLGTILESSMENLSVSGHSVNPDAVDIFSNTSSENGELDSSDGELLYPAELTTEGHALGTVVSEACGLSDVYPVATYPDARVDAYQFTPCGFSANGVIPSPQGPSATNYFTVHVTPEPHCSYASFETNVPSSQTGRETAEVVEQVVNIFKPGRFSVTLFEAKAEQSLDEGESGQKAAKQAETRKRARARMDSINGYRRVDRIVHELDGYELVFRYYERWDWEGGAPRIGELL
jgi:S-adenosylmethionine decarboxylase